MYGTHRFALPVSGTPETAAKLDAKTARAYHQRLFVPNGAIASVTGDVDAAAVIAALRERFGAWPSGALADPGPPPPAQAPAQRTIIVVDRPDLGQARIVVGHEGIARTDDDRIAVSLFNLILGGSGFSSRLMDALRAERGAHLRRLVRLFAAARARAVLRRDVHARRVDARGARHPARRARARAQRAARRGRALLGAHARDGQLLDGARDLRRGDGRARRPRRVRAAEGQPRHLSHARARGDARGHGAVAHAHLHPERAAIVLVGPAKAIVPQLEGLGPVQVVKP